ncbi:hypothetical protein PN498_08000 [Oscillatoria sp. CS-180]|uniref:hypothetical protein n=1 Tax=Oscillatoria sp. CS-180 TaxID=3021720 RepID=UPI00232EA3DB|nr:hypothetical protein [Oscillatoria sp. CS-180]MDB9525924.1 hypothetical protein [Oscillatoria sp. CS-180]
MDILHEDLVFDLRPLADNELADVQATYQVSNPGPDTTVDLLFVAPNLEAGQVQLNGESAITAVAIDAVPIPEDWATPAFSPSETNGLKFTLPLSQGEHSISVQYATLPDSDDQNIYRIHTLNYWLAPARQWHSFGTLTVDIFTPPGWKANFVPDIPKVGKNHWRQTFNGLPSDSIMLSSYLTLPAYVKFLRWILVLGSFGISILIVWRSYRWVGRLSKQKQWSQGWLVLAFLLLIPLGVPLFWMITGLGVYASESLLDSCHLAVGYAYGRLYLFAFLGLLGGAIALVTAIAGFANGHRMSLTTKA